MKKALCILLLTGGLAASLIAEPTKLGLGIFLGQPSGVCVGLDLNAVNWLDFKAAWNFAGPADSVNIIAQANYELAFPGLLVIQEQDIVPFVGIGLEVSFGSDLPQIGFRIPVGLNYRFKDAPLELFLEIGIGMYLFPATQFMGSGGLGGRYRL